jgi:hypothetical protein
MSQRKQTLLDCTESLVLEGLLPRILLTLGIAAAVTSAWASPTSPESATQNTSVWAVKPSDGDTGGGMGGTGHSVDDPRGMPLVPLSSTSQSPCPAGQTIGRYTLSTTPSTPNAGGSTVAGSAAGGAPSSPFSTQSPLCLNTIFTLTMGQQVTFFLPNDLRISAQTQGLKSEARIQTRVVSHRIWGERLEIDIFAYEGSALARINAGELQIPTGFVGQIWVEGSQAFFSLRKSGRN